MASPNACHWGYLAVDKNITIVYTMVILNIKNII